MLAVIIFQKGQYIVTVTMHRGRKLVTVANTKKGRHYHTHVRYSSEKAAQTIARKAFNGRIPHKYPAWIVESINRLWFGQGFMERDDLDNSNLLTNDPKVRFKRRNKRRGNKKYRNVPRHVRKES